MIQHSFDMVVPPFRDARQRNAACLGDYRKQMAGLAPVDGSMFEVDGQIVEPGSGHKSGGRDIAQ